MTLNDTKSKTTTEGKLEVKDLLKSPGAPGGVKSRSFGLKPGLLARRVLCSGSTQLFPSVYASS